MPPRVAMNTTTPTSATKLVLESPQSSNDLGDDISSSSNTSALFYLSTNINSEVESAYLTSEEVGYEPTDDELEKDSNSKRPLSKHSNEEGGIYLDPLFAQLFHLDFLPFQNDTKRSLGFSDSLFESYHTNELLDSHSSDDFSYDDDDDDDEDAEYEEDNNGIGQFIDLGMALPMDRKRNRGILKKRRNGPLRRIKRQINNSKHRRKERRHNRKHHRGKSKHCEIINDTSCRIESEMKQVSYQRKRLENVKASLKSTKNKAKNLMNEARQSAHRVSKLSKTIIELECKLDMSMRVLEMENSNIERNFAELAHLNAEEEALQRKSDMLESSLKKQLTQLETNVATASASQMNDLVLDASMEVIETPSFRLRSNTGETFVTAVEEKVTPVPILRQRSHSDGSSMKKKRSESILRNPSPVVVGGERVLTKKSSFLRVHDLEIDGNKHAVPIHDDSYHHVLDSLMNMSIKHATDEGPRWTPDSSTSKILAKRSPSEKWHYATDSDIFVWHGTLEKKGYKSDLPIIKARAMVQTSSRNLLDLIFDSSKVKQYNKMSLGREDKDFLKKGIDTNDGKIHGEVKITRSTSSVPLIKKKIELVTLMHAKALTAKVDDIDGYVISTRSVWEDEDKIPSENGNNGVDDDQNYCRSECLLGVNLIREVDENRCEITTVSHFYSPMAPSFGAKSFGMKASANFLKDIQSQFK